MEVISIHAPRTGSDHLRRVEEPRVHGYFNPRSPHGERRPGGCRRAPPQEISTHAPRTGSDGFADCVLRVFEDFNPRSPHGERHARAVPEICAHGISIHAPRTGSDGVRVREIRHGEVISIHAPRTGSDKSSITAHLRPSRFQSTLPARGATRDRLLIRGRSGISIHAPRTGSD